ncbi:MAG: PQQ-dependent sugar dehydrogenase, partial [Saprospiraceae bacterium]|nr:PQQ-dependent sugar dehydrogenase [Saprospiraceae bacterium]
MKNATALFLLTLFTLSFVETYSQYEVNPLMPITNDGYTMTVQKFVKIPDDGNGRPRINSFTFFEDRIFVSTELGGKIYEIVQNGNGYQPVLFLDVKAAIFQNTARHLDDTDGWHNGLRCVAFHPDFLNNGKLYTSLMEERPSNATGHHYISDVNNPIDYDGVLVEWTYNHATESVNVNSYREVFRVGMPVFDHTIKDIAFNRYAKPGEEDYGLLYITHGDGSELSAIVGGGQNNDALGKVLRINPLQSGSDTYSIPPSNPFTNDDLWLDEIYSLGHRNPHTICFGKDASDNVHIIVGEAGRDNMEEVNIIKKGGNYGWSQRDGTYVHLPQGGLQTGIAALPENDAINQFIYPSAQFSKVGQAGLGFASQAIAGGYVYTDPVDGKKIYLCA